jgi:hypothetical protein
MSALSARSNATDNRRDLTDKQRALVEAIVTAAEKGAELTREEAGTLAGYGTGDVARVQASRTLALPHVQDALRERLRGMAVLEAPAALMMLRHVRRTGRGMQQLTAGMKLLDIAGMSQPDAGAMSGQMIAVQVVLPGELGTLLTQGAAHHAQSLAIPAVVEGEHSLRQGEGGRKRSTAARPKGGRGGAQGGRKGGRGQKPPTPPDAGPHTQFSSSGGVSGKVGRGKGRR